MINLKIKKLIEKERKRGEFIYPNYEKYCFSNIPSTILSFFGVKTRRPILPCEVYNNIMEDKKPKKIILLLIDGLGFNTWMKYSKTEEFLNLFNHKGLVSPLTAVFPSTTAAALTTLSSGLTTQEHALLEWYVYFKELDKVIATLSFTAAGEEGQDKLLREGVNPKILFKGETIYQKLKRFGVYSATFLKSAEAQSAYSKLVYQGSEAIPFQNGLDLMTGLRKALKKKGKLAYFCIYWDRLDSAAHGCGPGSKEYLAELANLSFLLQKEFLEKIKSLNPEEIVFIITADHGEVKLNPAETIFLNKCKGLEDYFQKGKDGKLIPPTGSPRDVFFHIRSEKLKEAISFLGQKFKGKAEILKIDQAVKTGLFGRGKPHQEFLNRAGNLLLLPHKKYHFGYQYGGKEFPRFLGHHGGLSEEEMLIPFAIARLSDLG